MVNRNSHWFHAVFTFLLVILGAGILLPLVRVQPEAAHNFLNGLSDWIRIGFILFLCLVFVGVMFKLLSPRVRHLAHWRAHPPAWLAAFFAWIVVAIVDLFGAFDPNGYRATAWEWLGYGGSSLLIVGWYSGLWSEVMNRLRKTEESQVNLTGTVTLQDIEGAPWEEIAAWLQSDAAAEYDFIGNQSVAHRVSLLVAEGTRSVGIVGPFGAGKTSIITWVADRLRRQHIDDCRYLICRHSCWGFEDSASAIREMLRSAVSALSVEIDTFQIDSLPESYRKTFSAGGDWFEAISGLVLRNSDPMEQFSRLSTLLNDIHWRLVFIVEDLDRNETRNFEIQEVLAFLERLKEYPNLSFILTGGLSSSRIDYAKLCDHIEFLRMIDPRHSSGLIERVYQRCQDDTVFRHMRIGDPYRNYEWNPLSGVMVRDYKELSLPQAVAWLLNTPRALRHALGRTHSAWQMLHGEINFNHLLAVNVLRFGAPECFQFLLRRWDRVHSLPNRDAPYGQGTASAIRQAIRDDWTQTIKDVDWNPTAALQVMEFILPATEYWLVDDSRYAHFENGQQCVFERRYWSRAINEAVDGDDVRDQEVVRDVDAWLKSPTVATELVTKLTSLPRYGDVWQNLAAGFFVDRRDILSLCEKVISRILEDQGPLAGQCSQGFIHTWSFAGDRVALQPENVSWLRERISEAARVSLEMVNALWHFYGTSRRYSILPLGAGEPVRQHLLDSISANVTNGASLSARLSSNVSYTLYQLVFDPGNDFEKVLADVESWTWLGHHILDAMRHGDVSAAANCSVLLGARVSGGETMRVDAEVLDQFFGDARREVIDILESMTERLPEADQPLARNVVASARQHLAERPLLNDRGREG